MKVPRQLKSLVSDGIIDRVIRPLMAGKEAAVYVVEAHGLICCAKVYKNASQRSFKARADYQEGRSTRNTRRARAMKKGSSYGKRELESDWHNAEVDALRKVSAAGVRVPRIIDFTDGVLIMELIVDEDGEPAPRLNDVALKPETARAFHTSLLRDVVKMLCGGLIHGDLSEYNVLVDADGPVIIDLPQAVNAAANQSAERMFRRDVDNLAAYFGQFAPELKKADYGREIWHHYKSGSLDPGTELTGRFKRKEGEVNLGSVFQDIDDAADDARRRRPRPPKKKTKGDETWRGVVPDAEDDDDGDRGRSRKGRDRSNRRGQGGRGQASTHERQRPQDRARSGDGARSDHGGERRGQRQGQGGERRGQGQSGERRRGQGQGQGGERRGQGQSQGGERRRGHGPGRGQSQGGERRGQGQSQGGERRGQGQSGERRRGQGQGQGGERRQGQGPGGERRGQGHGDQRRPGAADGHGRPTSDAPTDGTPKKKRRRRRRRRSVNGPAKPPSAD